MIYLCGVCTEPNEGGDVLRDRDLVDGFDLDEYCLLYGGDSDRDLIEKNNFFL
jgi:hypothetical protein